MMRVYRILSSNSKQPDQVFNKATVTTLRDMGIIRLHNAYTVAGGGRTVRVLEYRRV